MKKLLWLVTAIVLTGCFDKDARIINYGIADNVITQTEDRDDLISGERHLIETWSIKSTTTQIPNKIGTEFGVAYRVNNKTQAATVDIEEVIIFPGDGLVNPSTGMRATADAEVIEIDPAVDQYFSYTLDYPWEAKPGTWIFQVKSDGEVLIEKSFMLSKFLSRLLHFWF